MMLKGMLEPKKMEQQQITRMVHPLINKSSMHYNSAEKTAIEMMEEMFTVNEMVAFCEVNIFKYNYRKDHKGQLNSDIAKIATYQNYLLLLRQLKNGRYLEGVTSVKLAYKINDIEMEYK